VKDKVLRDQIESVVVGCLAQVPFVRIENTSTPDASSKDQADLVINVRSPKGPRQLIVEAKTSGEPRLARAAINQARRYYTDAQENSYAVFVAPYISPRTAQLCTQEGVGYIDLSGNCRLCFDGVYIEREGRPNKFAQKRDLRKLYSPKATRVLRVLLSGPLKSWPISALAREAKVSIGLAWKVKELLADREWVSSESDGVIIKQPEELLADWASNYSYRQNDTRDFYSMQKPAHLERALAEACVMRKMRYALTAFSAAERMAPMVRYQRVFAYVDEGVEELAEYLGLKEVSSGANITVMKPYDNGIFYGTRVIEGIQIVSPIQTYLDLFSNKGRGEEAAQAIFQEVIRPQW
jgi:hypothetical protein